MECSSSKNSSGSIGVGMQLGAGGAKAGVTVSASAGKGQGAGNSNTYTNSHVSANQVTIDSGGDTTIRGGVVKADQVTAKVGGNLNIESLQDKSQYNEKSQQAGGSVTVGPAAGGSVNVGQTKINSDFLSVGEQSAIRAGDGGFDVSVNGKTNLTGGQITSTQAAIDNNKNSYEAKEGTTTTDVQNSAKYSAQSTSVGIAAGSKAPGAALSTGLSGVGIGNDKGSANSTTTAGISGITGNTSARTGDKETGLTQIFDKDKVQKEVAAQVAITSEFGKQASKAVGDYAATQLKKAQDAGDQAGIDAWKEGGANRVALHTLVGGLTGGVQGAVGAGTSQAVIDQVGQALKETDLPTELKQALVLAAGTAVGAAASGGSVAGGATAFNATANNYLTHAQLQSKQQQLAACKDDACRKNVTSTWDKVSQSANARVEDKVLKDSESTNLKTMEQLSADMNGLAQYKSGLETQLRNTTDPTQRANLQLQINEADNSMRQIANLGKDTLALMYQQTGNPQYQNAFQALTAATSGNELAGALTMPGGAGGNVNKAVQEAKSGVNVAEQAAIAKAKVETNARKDDAQQYVNNNAPIQVPNTVTRNDNDFTSTVNQRGNPKANIEENGNFVAANPKGTGSPTAHVSGSNPGNTPYISTTDAASVDPTLGGPKVYGTQQTTISARELQRDINSGVASQDIKIITNQQLVDQLQTKVDVAQRKFDVNPSDRYKTELDKANQSLNNAKRDGEVLIAPYVPPGYYTQPTGPVTPIVPVPKVPSSSVAPEQPTK